MEKMERGGFHGYRKPPQTSSGMQPPERTETTTTTNHNHHMITDLGIECMVREQDRFMPIANVIRIMRKILPPHAKVSDDSKETIQECVSEFISFVTSEANDRCQREQRKTITAEDILWGMSKLGFDDYVEPLTLYLNRYRESEGDSRGSVRSEPFVKRSAFDLGASSSSSSGTRFAPVFDLGPNPYGFFGSGVAVGEFVMNDGSNGGSSSQAGVTSNEPYANCNK